MPDRIDPAAVLGIDPTDRSFAAYLTAQERDQLDARAATAEQERDDALDDRDAYKEARDVAQQLATVRQGVIDDLNAETMVLNDTIRTQAAELGAAGDVLAVVRDAVERIDRALAVYDTTPGEGGVTITLDNSAGTFTPRHPGDALADALRNAYTTEHLASIHERLVDELGDDSPREDPLGRLVDALFAARWQTQPAGLGSPPPRAQEPTVDPSDCAFCAAPALDRLPNGADVGCPLHGTARVAPTQEDDRTAGYEIVARRLHRADRGALVSGDVVASAVSTRPTLAEAVDELRRAIGPAEREG